MKKIKETSLLEQTKCAPNNTYNDGSCFTFESLQEISINYNKKNKDQIDIHLDKSGLVKVLQKKLQNVCTEQTCWLRLDIVKALSDSVTENTFRPEGPIKKNEWLNTTNINEVLLQYQNTHKDFYFLGAVPLDFDNIPILGIKDLDLDDLITQGKTKIGLVINHDEHWKNGSHWVGLFIDLKKNNIYYFDSIGNPPLLLIKKFITRIVKFLYFKKFNKKLPINNIINCLKKYSKDSKDKDNRKYYKNLIDSFDIKFNHIQHQFGNSECGIYSINFIIDLIEGRTFDDIINNIQTDNNINLTRKIFFRNNN